MCSSSAAKWYFYSVSMVTYSKRERMYRERGRAGQGGRVRGREKEGYTIALYRAKRQARGREGGRRERELN